MHCLAHPDGEKATSRAAARMNIPMGLSTYATTSLEDVRREGGDNPYAFQLSIVKDRNMTLSWIKRAEAAGYRALFITVDAPVLAKRASEKVGKKFQLPEGMDLPNLSAALSLGKSSPSGPVRSYIFEGRDPSNSWESVIPWVKKNTNLEIWLKGSKLEVVGVEGRNNADKEQSTAPRMSSVPYITDWTGSSCRTTEVDN
jgi:(S)-2-hydroxy-acid oxidase